ncbi:MAG: hypothetical protein IT204_15310 [Fimbriimonadaceae bacterium]|nr:hypothetical protein [Fimbriimonadaceae bacterium]
MIVLQLDFHLRQPALLSTPGGDPNREVSLDYLPGSQIRGWAIGCWLRAGRAFDPALFLRGGGRFLNGYPLLAGGPGRALPAPHSWMVAKRAPEADRAVVDLALDEAPPAQLRTAARWQAAGGGLWYQPQPLREVFVSTARDPRQGRATADSGEVFQVEALAAGQSFRSLVLCEQADAAEQLATLLLAQPTAALGGDRQAHYGLAEVVGQRLEQVVEWPAAAPAPDGPAAATELRLVLLSPALLRDPVGQSSTDPTVLATAVGRALGCQATLSAGFVAVEWCGGFNRTWGLPVPQEWCFAAGTTLVMQLDRPADETARAALLDRGLGERRAEGYGRLALDPPSAAGEVLAEPPAAPFEAPALQDAAAAVARTMLQRRQQQLLEAAVTRRAHDIVRAATTRPGPLSKTQLHRLRDELQSWLADPAGAPARLEAYQDSVRERTSVARPFQRARIVGHKPLDWIAGLFDPAALWGQLGGETAYRLALGGVVVAPDEPLAQRTALALVDRVVQLLAKTKGES